MDWLTVICEYLEKDKELVLRAIQEAKHARDNAPSAMESGSDTTRSEKERLVFALQSNLVKIDMDIKIVKEAKRPTPNEKIGIWSYVEISSNETTMSLFIVPNGMGGKKINNVQLVSTSSLLGQVLIGKMRNDNLNFSGKNWKIMVSK